MSDITTSIVTLKQQIPASVKLVAVSKTKQSPEIMDAYNAGHNIFGENRVQELLSKKDLLPDDVEWHFIGHLQTNKVKYIVPFISMIQSVDTFRLLKIINAEALKVNRIIDCLLQFHIASEETKFGFSIDEAVGIAESEEFNQLTSVRICGVMGMATFTSNEKQVRKEFRHLVSCFNELKLRYFKENQSFREISMGMSADYKVAIDEGSTMIRIGSIIFGERNHVF
jgi:pyridoxal phosphate enzyme (YggS family)